MLWKTNILTCHTEHINEEEKVKVPNSNKEKNNQLET